MVSFLPNISADAVIVSGCFSSLWAFIYLFNKVTDLQEDAVNVSGLPIQVVHCRRVLISSVICLLAPLPFLINRGELLALYIVLAIAGYFYSAPLFLKRGKRLKDILFIKNIVSAICWASIPTLVPAFYYDQVLSIETLILWLNFFVFIFAVEVVWDIRDIDGDRAAGIKTIPNVFGVLPSKIICLLPVLVMFFWRLMSVAIHPIYMVAYVLTILSIILVKQTSHPYFFQSMVIIWIVAYGLFLIQYYI